MAALKGLLKLIKMLSKQSPDVKFRLITIGFSHYCEKARWAIENSPLREIYVESVHCPALHLSDTLLDTKSLPRISPWGKESLNIVQDKHTFRKEITAVPKLVVRQDSSPVFHVVGKGSHGILKYLAHCYKEDCGNLYPDGELGEKAEELEHYFDSELGNSTSDWVFSNMLLASGEENSGSQDYFINLCVPSGAPLIEKVLFSILGKSVIIPMIVKGNSVTELVRDAALERILNVFKTTDALLAHRLTSSKNRRYLLGTDEISAADITLAALAIPVLLPEETKRYFGGLNEIDMFAKSRPIQHVGGLKRVAEVARQLRATPTGKYVLELYARDRNMK